MPSFLRSLMRLDRSILALAVSRSFVSTSFLLISLLVSRSSEFSWLCVCFSLARVSWLFRFVSFED